MLTPPQAHRHDNGLMLAAIALLAYVSADVAHHAAGHGLACLLSGGQIERLSSVFVQCSCKSAFIDLAGPFANLVLGSGALTAVRVMPNAAPPARLFWLLTAAFNLFFFAGQLVFDVALKTDDWAWPMRQYGVPEPLRYGLLLAGCAGYALVVRRLIGELACFAAPPGRAFKLVYRAWLMAGLIACATALLDTHPAHAIFYQAAPQSMVLTLGLLLAPAPAARRALSVPTAAAIGFSLPWVVGAIAVAVASLLFLGPGTAIRL